MTDSVTIAAELAAAAEGHVQRLVEQRAASRISEQDPTLWGPAAEAEAAIRLGWTKLHATSRDLIGDVATLRSELAGEGIERVVLAGMGGSSLAPEVISRTEGVPLTILDTTDPGQVADALAGDLNRTVLVVSSKSGTTVETDSQRRIFAQAFAEQNPGVDPGRRMIVVTDPGSPLAELADKEGYRRLFLADPNVGGRYSALSAFGLVPAGLAGADIARLLDQAAVIREKLAADDPQNPAIRLAAALAAAHDNGAEKLVIADHDSGIPGLGDWIEQLIAESTGKDRTGVLPVIVESVDAPGFADAGADATTVAIGEPVDGAAVSVRLQLGEQFLFWEYVTALLGSLLSINPFDQPDVEAAKKAARGLLDSPGAEQPEPALTAGAVQVFPGPGVSAGGDLTETIRKFAEQIPEGGYLAVQAYLNREDDASASLLRTELAKRTGRQVTFGWGPRFLHSTGQYHKGGHPNGAFLQITGDSPDDLEVPGRPYTLGELQLAQALGDGQVLSDLQRPVLRLHLADRAAGLADVVRAIQGL
ncbi:MULTISPECIES: glucose-6-phosphate isomerase [Thermocrispum]|uniref:Glucose-6-phosphate isomerase n=1 Tax=Thermocrispum agreste TaxID=37925 RepID=A0ABD6FI35_9PSEU|nr:MULTISPECIES: glucose-6-phosphate isomerase [Thermocrispum]